MNRILSVSFYLFFLYLYIYKTYGKVKNTDQEISNIYGTNYYLRNGFLNGKNGKGNKYEDLQEEGEGENDDEEHSNSEESDNDEENEIIVGQKKKSKKSSMNLLIGM
ncbi:S-antigen protein [Plasmodium falciparum NF135/5.C10]|uniref:S-antigen protein n=1 Tax=Plasmodium falciparum NF135/5.C10 TaxID=1036726 RepID=W4IGJ9_PLAFA|nr:S-antigen protein [Plasmodium falciparum NF135/5.C10]